MVCVWLKEVGKPGLDMDDPNPSRVLVFIPQVNCISVLICSCNGPVAVYVFPPLNVSVTDAQFMQQQQQLVLNAANVMF